jgi:transposase
MKTTAEPLKNITLGPALTREQAKRIYRQGEEAVIFALLTLAQQSAPPVPSPSPTTPSAMVPPYQKPTTPSRGKRPGRKTGHPGSRRPVPERIDQRRTHRLPRCPDCGGSLKRCEQTRTRYTEDIPQEITPVVTEHTIHRDWCPRCARHVEPVVPDALPKATLGNRVLVLSAWLHYGLGNTLSQIVEIFNHHLQIQLTEGGLIQMWYRLQTVLFGWYLQIQAEAMQSAVLHADETGWRVNGKTHWLWCFSSSELTFYMIDRSRGSPALRKFFQDEFQGTLISDFWGAYNAVVCRKRQMCLVHLLRDLEYVESYKRLDKHWAAFAKKLRRLIGDAIRLWRRDNTSASEFASRRARLDVRLGKLIETTWRHPEAHRLVKRLRRHRNELFTFLDEAGVPFDNNHAERAIRPAVLIRKNSYSNRSRRGADAQAVLMSVYRTLKQRGYHPIDTIVKAIESYLTTGKLPSLPVPITADG